MADEAAEDSVESAVADKPKPKQPKPARSWTGTLIAIAVIVAAGGFYEYRRAEGLDASLASAQAQTTALQAQLTGVQQQLRATSDKLNELAKKNLPMSIVFRPSQSGPGLQAFFKNNSPEQLTVGVLLSNPVTSRRREFNTTIPANSVQEISDSQGWLFTPGQHILITHAQFGSVDFVVPSQP